MLSTPMRGRSPAAHATSGQYAAATPPISVRNPRRVIDTLAELIMVQSDISCTRAGCSFDHLIGNREQRRRHGEAEYSGSFGVDDQLVPRRLHHRKVGGLCALEDAAGVNARLTKPVRDVGSVAHQ